MGVVYKARQVRLNRVVALKMVLTGVHARPAELNRFLIEAETVARLDHPNIVQVYEVGADQGRPFIALEYVAGGGLADHLRRGPWPWAAPGGGNAARSNCARGRGLRPSSRASSTATSSPPTSFSPMTGRPRWSISAWPSWPKRAPV